MVGFSPVWALLRRIDPTMRRSRTVSALLVEAEQDDRHMYAEFLRAKHVTPVEVGTTDAALRLAEAVDVVVTGIRVPGPFDGLGLVMRLRQQPRTAQVRIIVLTACAFPEDREHAFAAGCDAFLAKPCLPAALLSEIERQLAGTALEGLTGASRSSKLMAKAQHTVMRSRDLLNRLRRRS
jgi:CheY-like chemotaxis protein